MKKYLLSFCLAFAAFALQAQTRLFHTGDESGHPYRIPAIAVAPNGDLIAFTDRRPCGGDIGYGRVDLLARTSADNGATWSAPVTILEGTGKGPDTGFGDACLVADRERNEALLVCVAGDVPYWASKIEKSQRLVSLRGKYDKKSRTWRFDPKDLKDHTEAIYHGLLKGKVNGLFMGSGRICQSRMVKTGKYYRLYGALCTHRGNFVIYSDDFGDTWQLLGSPEQSCAPKGDEPKCEELPDGSVLLSSRKHGGRYFNVFRFSNAEKGEGIWGHPVDTRLAPGGISNEGTPCNGEILLVKARNVKSRAVNYLALQSIPAGPKRSNVTIYWKSLDKPTDYNTPLRFASNWPGKYQVTAQGSAYSTMVQQADGRIAFYYEEEPEWYQMIYRAIGIDEITGGEYEAVN